MAVERRFFNRCAQARNAESAQRSARGPRKYMGPCGRSRWCSTPKEEERRPLARECAKYPGGGVLQMLLVTATAHLLVHGAHAHHDGLI